VGEGHKERVRIVRALVERCAELTEDERTSLHDVWRLRRAMLDQPVNVERKNPLVWRIIHPKDLPHSNLTVKNYRF